MMKRLNKSKLTKIQIESCFLLDSFYLKFYIKIIKFLNFKIWTLQLLFNVSLYKRMN